MPSGGRRLPPWTSPRGAAEAVPQRWSPCTPAGSGNHVTPPLSAGCCSYRVTPPVSGGGCSRPPRAPPAVDSPYLRAKQEQLIEKDPNKAVPLFWAAINSGERIESALKDMATVLKQANRAEEAIEAIRSSRHRCPNEAQESLDNILLDLYKKCGRTKEQIEMLTVKLRMVDEDLASGRWKAKLSKSHGRVVYLSLRDEKARLLGNLAWAYMQSENYEEAEMLYRQALAMEADYNKECNLAICLMKMGKASVSVDTEKHGDCNSQVLPSPVTQLKHKGPQIMAASDGEKNGQSLQEYEYLSRLFNDAATPQSQLEKLRKRLVRKDRPNISTQDQVQTPSSAECLPKPNGAMDASENPVQEGKGLVDGGRKAWADMVEEEQQLGSGKNTSAQGESSKDASEQRDKTSSSSQGSSSLKTPVAGVPGQSSAAGSWRCNDSRTSTDENVNRNFARTAPAWKQQKVQDHSNRVCQMLNTMHLNEKAQGTKQTPSRSSALFHSHAPFGDNGHSQGANHTEATNRWPKNAASTRPWRPQNRLRVFQEITNEMKQNVA
ncbi:protein POLLENLESS 3-like isoform X2 [Triticum dicoccoides]|uniref:protein POLLENLESS 3-like isoform X2 n=1 Tax=Triticum dicoccoides TaxID=85692 RepID=UPI001891538E|nr:protein POLLENLESS 3-like isoform X2 [Triticum dicoccoides]